MSDKKIYVIESKLSKNRIVRLLERYFYSDGIFYRRFFVEILSSTEELIFRSGDESTRNAAISIYNAA